MSFGLVMMIPSIEPPSHGLSTMLELDHATVVVQNLAAAASFLEAKLGFRVTATPQAPDSHGRVLLDRSYLQVATGAGKEGEQQKSLIDCWGHYYLRAADVPALVEEARSKRLNLSEPAIYDGHDGQWLDVEIHNPGLQSLLPTIVKRLTPVEVAVDWPPPLREHHPNGALTLTTLYLLARSRSQAVEAAEVLSRLTGQSLDREHAGSNPFLSTQERLIRFPGGRAIVIAYHAGGGSASALSGHDDSGLIAAGFAVSDLDYTKAFMSSRGHEIVVVQSDGEARSERVWLKPEGKLGVTLFFESQAGA